MRRDLLNFSTDLLRISNWIYFGQDQLANKFLDISKGKYVLEVKWQTILEKIANREGGRIKAADRASTLSRLMFFAAAKVADGEGDMKNVDNSQSNH